MWQVSKTWVVLHVEVSEYKTLSGYLLGGQVYPFLGLRYPSPFLSLTALCLIFAASRPRRKKAARP